MSVVTDKHRSKHSAHKDMHTKSLVSVSECVRVKPRRSLTMLRRRALLQRLEMAVSCCGLEAVWHHRAELFLS